MKLRIYQPVLGLVLLFSFTAVSAAGDYFEDLVDPKDRMERGPEVHTGFDFDNVVFDREYFYSLNEGILQFRHSNKGPWKTLDLNLGVMKRGGEELTEVSSEKPAWEREDSSAESVARPEAPSEPELQGDGTKGRKKVKTREEVLRELRNEVESKR